MLLIIMTLVSIASMYQMYISPDEFGLGTSVGVLIGFYPFLVALEYIIDFIIDLPFLEISLDEYIEIGKIYEETKYEAVKNLIKEMLKKEKITGRDYLKIKKLESLCIDKEKEEIWLLERKEKKQKERNDIDNIRNKLKKTVGN